MTLSKTLKDMYFLLVPYQFDLEQLEGPRSRDTTSPDKSPPKALSVFFHRAIAVFLGLSL